MNNEIQVFNNEEFGEIRTITIDGEIYFVGTDVAKALGYTNSRKAIKDHVDKKDVTKRYPLWTNGGIQQVNIINESGFYSLVLASKIPGAKRFKHWVTSEVIPSIRKTGAYSPKIEQKPMIYIEKVENLNVYAGGKTMNRKDDIKPFLSFYINEITQKSKGKHTGSCPLISMLFPEYS